MMHAGDVPGQLARGAALAALLVATTLPFSVQAAAAQAAPAETATPATAPASKDATAPRPLSESVAAIVNDEIISTYDLAQRMRLLIATSGIQPSQENLPQFQRQALVSLIDEHLQLHELKRVEKQQKMSIIATDDEVRDEISGMARENNMTVDQFLSVLKQQGIGQETLYQQVRAQMSWQRWIQGRYGSRLRIGEDQIKATEARLAAVASKPQYEVSEVLIDTNRAGGVDAAMKGAQQLIGQMQQGAPFAAVARQFSAAPTAASGGDAGWISPGEMPPEVDAAMEQLRPGQLSAPIQTKDGVYIIYLRNKRAGAGATVVDLKQAAISLPESASAADVEAARAKLMGVRAAAKGCDGLSAAAAKAQGVVAGDLGEAEIADLAPEFRQAAQTLEAGQISEPIRTKVGLHLVAVCGKRASGGAQLSHDQIENRLYGQQLAMVARRYMRDLRNSATIETR
ncbi:MAG TPA: peptidylprolyl isomerase [Phenylobacterium sp.]|uniref:peptidylprolyl isomerase n=1 Tax=Phenylobacterium sp. TaxID=1871053 RepID=UPI002B490DB3|nr:peptidylprolyl isomerase [Phenylobacterium sp.]HKR90035.1 peptidylprolyl isomerase [Phenylobacterium sp.]